MAEALVGVLIERLASITDNKFSQELKLVVGVDKEIEILTSTLKAIQAVLEDAEHRQVQDASVRLWLSNLREVSDAIDDVLDEWSYEILKQQIVEKQREEEGGGHAPVAKKKVCFSIPSPCCCCSSGVMSVNRVVRRHDIAKRIKDVSEKLALIDAERQTYQFQSIERSPEQKLIKHQKTSSLLDISFGRDYEKESLIRKLLNEGGEEDEEEGEGGEKDEEEDETGEKVSVPVLPPVPHIIPIVGMGGVGKTTLSQLVYNDERVKAHFDQRIWICVSEPFEEIQIVAAIAQGLGIKSHPMANPLEVYSQFIFDSIKEIEDEEGKMIKEKTKFLIVLDDVWNPTESQWEQVIKPLRVGAEGSRILVTTRIKKVAVMMGVAKKAIHLKMLSEGGCRSLFFHFASIGREIKDSRMIEVGNEIAKKCKGLPLTAKTLGTFMRSKTSLREWEGVLNSSVWKIKEFEQHVFQPLLLSYYDLTPTVRRCFLCCALFPKDFQIDKSELIHLWMSQDCLCVKEEIEDIYMVGEAYFDDLIIRSFFKDFKRDRKGNIISCKMHDIVHDFVHYLTNSEFLILDHKFSSNKVYFTPAVSNNKVRHIALRVGGGQSVYFPPANTRTVILDGQWLYGVQSLFQLRSLRTLNMSSFGGVIPNGIGALIHLRYLKLTHNPSEELPETLCDLYNLQTLIVTSCGSLRKLPHGMGKLINLRHLDVRGCGKLDVRSLEELPGRRTTTSVIVTLGGGAPFS